MCCKSFVRMPKHRVNNQPLGHLLIWGSMMDCTHPSFTWTMMFGDKSFGAFGNAAISSTFILLIQNFNTSWHIEDLKSLLSPVEMLYMLLRQHMPSIRYSIASPRYAKQCGQSNICGMACTGFLPHDQIVMRIKANGASASIRYIRNSNLCAINYLPRSF